MAHIMRDAEAQRRKDIEARTRSPRKQNKLLAQSQSKMTREGFSARVPLPEAERERRENELILLYFKWDMDGSGAVDFEELRRALRTFMLPDNAEKTEVLQQLFEGAVKDGQLPASGVNQPQFVGTFMTLLDDVSADEFNVWARHIHDTIQFIDDLTEDGRQKQAIFQVFIEFPKRGGGKVGWSELEQVIRETNFYMDNNLTAREIIDAASDENVPDSQFEFSDFLKRQRTNLLLDLQQFHKFIKGLTLNAPPGQIYDLLQQIKHVINYERRDHIVSKHLKTGLDKVFDVGSIENVSSSALDRTDIGSVVLTALRDSSRNQELKEARLQKLRQEVKHSLDAINVRDVEAVTNAGQHVPSSFEIVAAVVCVLFRIPPAVSASRVEYPYLESFRRTITSNIKSFICALTDFNTATITSSQLNRAMKYYHHPDFDSNRLVIDSWFMAALCTWAKAVLHIACLENEYVPEYAAKEEHQPVQLVSNFTLDKLINESAKLSSAVGDDKDLQDAERLPRLPILDTAFSRYSYHDEGKQPIAPPSPPGRYLCDRNLVGKSALLPSPYVSAGVRKLGANATTFRPTSAGVPWPIQQSIALASVTSPSRTRPSSARTGDKSGAAAGIADRPGSARKPNTSR